MGQITLNASSIIPLSVVLEPMTTNLYPLYVTEYQLLEVEDIALSILVILSSYFYVLIATHVPRNRSTIHPSEIIICCTHKFNLINNINIAKELR